MLNLIYALGTYEYMIIGAISLVVIVLIIVLIFSKKKKKLEEKNIEEIKETKEENIIVEEATPKEDVVEEEIEANEEEKKAPKKKQVIGKYEIFRVNDFYLYRLKASNGEIMVVSEIYKSVRGCEDAIETLKKNIELGQFTIYQDKHYFFQFKLYSQNKRLLAQSANYSSKDRCESAIESFKRFAFVSPIVVLDEDKDHYMELISLDEVENKKGGKIIVDPFVDDNESEFRLIANNGALLCSSISYKSQNALYQAIDNFKESINDGSFFIVKDKNDMYQFKLYSKTGRCIVVGESYKSKTNALNAASSVKAFAPLSEIEVGR